MTDETGLTKSFRMSNITLNQPYLLVLYSPICFSLCSSTISLNIMSRRTEMDFTSHILFHLGSHTILQNFLVAAASSVSNVLLRIYFLVFFFSRLLRRHFLISFERNARMKNVSSGHVRHGGIQPGSGAVIHHSYRLTTAASAAPLYVLRIQ